LTENKPSFIRAAKWTSNSTYTAARGQPQANSGLVVAIAHGLSNDTVRDLHCPHPCGEYEKGKEKEKRNGNDSEQCHKPIDGSRGKAL